MGSVPPKYMLPSAPYGQSDAVNAVNAVQPSAMNPQTPLLPPNFTDPGKSSMTPMANAQAPQSPFAMNPPTNPQSNLAQRVQRSFFGGQ